MTVRVLAVVALVFLPVVLVYTAFNIPFATFLMATYYRGISDDLIEIRKINQNHKGY